MPRVPSFVPRVGLAAGQGPGLAAPGVEPLRDQTGRELQGIGQGAMSFGYGLSRVGEQMFDEHVETKLREKDNRLQEVVRQRLEGQEGYLRKLGKSAVGEEGEVREQVLDDLRNDFEALTGDLSPYEREAFARVAMSRWQTAVGRVDEHEAKQQRAWSIGESEARARSMAAAAVESAGTPDYEVWIGSLRNEVSALAELAGFPEDSAQRTEMLQQAASNAHEAAIGSLVDSGRLGDARALLERATKADELLPDRAARLQRHMQTAEVAERGQILATTLEGGPLTQRIARAQALFDEGKIDVRVYDEAVRRMIAMDNLQGSERSAQRAGALKSAQAWAQANRGAAVPVELRRRMEEAGVAQEFAVWEAQGGRWVTTPAGRRALDLANDESLRAFRTVEALEDAYRLDLDEDDMSAMRAKWAKATGVTGDPQDAMKLDLKLQVTRFLQKKGTLPDEVDDRDDTTVETLKRFEEAVIRQVNQTPGASGRMADIDKAMEAIWKEGVQIGGKWKPDVLLTTKERQGRRGSIGVTRKVGGETVVTQMDVTGWGGQARSTAVRLADGTVVDRRPVDVPARLPSAEEVAQAIEFENRQRRAAGQPEIPMTINQIGERIAAAADQLDRYHAMSKQAADDLTKGRGEKALDRLGQIYEQRMQQALLEKSVAWRQLLESAQRDGRALPPMPPVLIEEIHAEIVDSLTRPMNRSLRTLADRIARPLGTTNFELYGITPEQAREYLYRRAGIEATPQARPDYLSIRRSGL